MSTNWKRCTPRFKCPHCDHDSYCCQGQLGWLCMRVESTHPVPMKDGALGWFHFDESDPAKRRALPKMPDGPPVPRPDFRALIETWSKQTPYEQTRKLAAALGVLPWSLGVLGCCWSESHRAWAFPMSDERGEIIGIRLRYDNGQKRAVLGTNGSGLFIPDMEPQKTLFLTEGPTSTAAAISMGLWAVGRPNNCAGGGILNAFIARHRVREAVIWADNDEDQIRPDGSRWNPGIEGAQRYTLPCRSTVLLTPVKDARVFLQMGGTAEQLESKLRGVVWRQKA